MCFLQYSIKQGMWALNWGGNKIPPSLLNKCNPAVTSGSWNWLCLIWRSSSVVNYTLAWAIFCSLPNPSMSGILAVLENRCGEEKCHVQHVLGSYSTPCKLSWNLWKWIQSCQTECDKRKTSRLPKLGEAVLSIVCKLLCRPIIPFLEDIDLQTLFRSKLVRVE